MKIDNKRLLWLAVALAVMAITLPYHQPVTAGGQPECLPLIVTHTGAIHCYWPDQMQMAEQQLSVRLVRPLAAVARVTSLTLHQELILSYAPPSSRKVLTLDAIVYVFGLPTLRSANRTIEPPFVQVEESIGYTPLSSEELKTTVLGPHLWSQYANLSGHNLTLSVETNMGARSASSIVQAIASGRGHDLSPKNVRTHVLDKSNVKIRTAGEVKHPPPAQPFLWIARGSTSMNHPEPASQSTSLTRG